MTIEIEAQTHSASRVILASPRTLFRAFVDPEMLASWRAPEDMTATLTAFDPRPGGGYRMVLRYPEPGEGKTSADTDWVEVKFTELVAEERIVELVTFTSEDPAFAGEMRLTTSFMPVADGTKVTMIADHVRPGIGQTDHETAMASSLRKLALLTE